MISKYLTIGCGDIGIQVAKKCRMHNWQVTALSRSDRYASEFLSHSMTHLKGDLDLANFELPQDISEYGIFYFAPPPNQGNTDPRIVKLLTLLPDKTSPKRIVYMSTTGVYGDCNGQWITEMTPTNPTVDRSKRRLDAERRVTEFCEQSKIGLVILRVAGIYGPGRLPVERIKSGTPVLSQQEALPSNRIHAEDLAEICLKAMTAEHLNPVEIFNVADGNPSTMSDYFFKVAELLKLPKPPEVDWQEAQKIFTPAMLSYLCEARKIDNTKLIKKLQVKLQYPDLVAGLQHISVTNHV